MKDIESEYSKNTNSVLKKAKTYNKLNNFDLQRKGSYSYNDLIGEIDQSKTTDKVRSLLKLILNNNVGYESNKVLIEIFIKSTNLTEIELETISLFNSVAKYSNEYWNNYDNNNLKKNNLQKSCDPQNQRYFADAMGFVFFGGLAGIGYSWAVYEFQEGGSSCI